MTFGNPELTPELIATLVAGVREEFAGRDASDVMARRDLALRELMANKARLRPGLTPSQKGTTMRDQGLGWCGRGAPG